MRERVSLNHMCATIDIDMAIRKLEKLKEAGYGAVALDGVDEAVWGCRRAYDGRWVPVVQMLWE